MDVVNGKIVSARTERSRSDIWRALKPSRGLLQEAGPCPQAGKPAGSLRGYSLPVVPGAAAFDQPGWKWSWRADQSPSWGRDLHHKWCGPSSEFISRAFLDKELDMCESRVSRAVIDRFASTKSVGKVTSMTTSFTPAVTSDAPLRVGAPAANPLKRPHSEIDQVDGPWIAPLRYLLRKVMSVSDVGELGRIVLPKKDAEGQLPSIDTKGKQLEMKDYSVSKSWFFHYKWWVNNKSRMYVLENTVMTQLNEIDDTRPVHDQVTVLHFPVCYTRHSPFHLTGDLQQLLESRRGKARSTIGDLLLNVAGGFIKYHGLEANDSFFVYEDSCGNFVARGQKKLTWNPQLDTPVTNSEPGSSDVKNSKSEKRPTSTEDESCCINSTTPLSASALG